MKQETVEKMKQIELSRGHLKTVLEGRIAFWKYDLFPYLLSGKIFAEHKDKGRYFIESYGNGSIFKSELILDEETGKQLQKDLEDIEKRRSIELKQVKEKYKKELIDIGSKYSYK